MRATLRSLSLAALLLGAGCTFSIPSIGDGGGAAGDDLAVPPDTDLGTSMDDLAVPPGSDLAVPPGDLAQPPPDLTPPPDLKIVAALAITNAVDVAADNTLTSTVDWAHFGYSSTYPRNEKMTGTAIGVLSQPASSTLSIGTANYIWTDGTPVMAATTPGRLAASSGEYAINVDVGTTPRTIQVYAGVNSAAARLSVSLSGTSLTDMRTLSNGSAQTQIFTITVQGDSPTSAVTIHWTRTDNGSGEIRFSAVTVN